MHGMAWNGGDGVSKSFRRCICSGSCMAVWHGGVKALVDSFMGGGET